VKQPDGVAYWRANKLDRMMMGRLEHVFGIADQSLYMFVVALEWDTEEN